MMHHVKPLEFLLIHNCNILNPSMSKSFFNVFSSTFSTQSYRTSLPLNHSPLHIPSSCDGSYTLCSVRGRKRWNHRPFPLPHRTMPEPKGQDLDFINFVHSHLIHLEWPKLNSLAHGLTPFRVNHILVKTQKDHVLSLEFFTWAQQTNPNSQTLETHSIILHILTKSRKFRSAEALLKKSIIPKCLDSSSDLFDSLVSTYRLCNSSHRVFDALFKTYAHMSKFRDATDTFCRMRDYGFLPKVESCNAYMSTLLGLNRSDIVLSLYREMLKCRISPNIYTLNMVICAYCNSSRIEKAVEVFREIEKVGCRPNVVSFNTLIDGHCKMGLLNAAMKLKSSMPNNGLYPNVVTYNTLIHGLCKKGKLHEANKLFCEMKAANVAPNTVTYNSLINGCSEFGDSEMGCQLHMEMVKNGVPVDILTYNSLILGLCKDGKTRKASYIVKEIGDKEGLVPNASTFAALITGQCKRQNTERAFQLYKTMIRRGYHPNSDTFITLISSFCKNEDFEGGAQILREMLDRGQAPDSTLFVELFEGLCRCGNSKMVERLLRDMEARRLNREGFDESMLMKMSSGSNR
ncbi:pentatricopeptide repeat-containing protein At4g26680, mitochondrial [Amborella trichopoda]|nr:pentatricopeptide repeat-containing protein At4g26680, mitochondrial [Amborella trichopoda]|eukprot:XP_006843235.2 pentatricopeptide repeat-containing protein At4g26680, mitochondrial [Amborella trichopoda]